MLYDLLNRNQANRATVVAVVVVRVRVVRVEVRVPCVVLVVRVRSGGPVVAVGTCVVDARAVAVARKGQGHEAGKKGEALTCAGCGKEVGLSPGQCRSVTVVFTMASIVTERR